MSEAGVRMVIYSTPCLFAAQGAVMAAMERLKANQGRLADSPPEVKLGACTQVLQENLARSIAT